MSYSESVIKRYKKICALAESGTGGEKDAAIAAKKRLEDKYPGIQKELEPEDPRKVFQDFFSGKGFDDSDLLRKKQKKKKARSDMWDDLSNRASDFFSRVKDFTFSAIGIQKAKEMAQDCNCSVRSNRASISVNFRISNHTLDVYANMNEDEKFAFLEEAAQMFADTLSDFVEDNFDDEDLD